MSGLIENIRKESRILSGISFGIFLFILFFQPFPLDKFEFNNKLLFVAGLGIIIFLFMVVGRIVLPGIIRRITENRRETILPTYIRGFIILALNSIAFAFYMKYVGFVSISFYIMFKIALICLVPPIILWLYDMLNELRLQNESLIEEKKIVQKQIEKYEEDFLNKSIEFISEKNNENLNLLISDVVYIKSADNYVEIAYKEGENFERKLLRNTLKNIEQQIKPYSNFIRCHRICIVNTHYIEKLNKNYNNNWLSIKGYNEHIPVSRQYLLKIKEIL